MPLTLAQLRTIITRDEALQDLLDTLESLGFNTTAWQSGSIQRTLLTAYAQVESVRTQVTDALSRLGFNTDSEGDALTALADSHYDNQRVSATSTLGTMVLTGGAVGPPHSVAAGDVVAADADGRTFRNTTAGTVPASGTLSLTFQAETPGADGNVANSTVTILQTPLAGVTIDNPDPGSGSWITTLGADAETDATLQDRNTAKWGVLSPSDPRDRYESFVREAVPTAPRVEVDDSNPRGPGTLDVYMAGATATATGADVVAGQTELDRIKNPTADALAIAAPEQSQDFTYTAYILTASNTTATQAAIEQALRDYTNSLDIGGEIFPDSPNGIWVRSEAIAAMTAIDGVERVEMSLPAANITVTAHNIITVGTVTATHTPI